jgi:plasmid maintenance system killer protein
VESFLVSAYELPKEIAKKVFKALRNFVANPTSTGLHLEKHSGRASQLSSIRVDEDYRIFFTKAGPTAVMLYVAKHDLAYRYAESLSGTVPIVAGFAGMTVGAKWGLFSESVVNHEAEPPFQALPAGAASVDLDVIEGMVGGKYLPLARHFAKQEHLPVQLRFSDVEGIIGKSLPDAARKYRAWWGNESSPYPGAQTSRLHSLTLPDNSQ